MSLSLLALEKSSAPAIRGLAADLIVHHGPIGRGLNDMLGNSAFDLPITGYMSNQSHLQGLAAMNSETFDQIVFHEITVAVDERARLFDAASHRHGNLSVRALARNFMPNTLQDANRVHAFDIHAQLAQDQGH